MPPSPAPGRRVVILAARTPFTDDLLALLAQRGVRVAAVLVYVPSLAREWRAVKGRAGRLRWLALAPLRWASRRVKVRLRPPRPGAVGPLVVTGVLNGQRMTRDLRRLAPDLVVLSRCAMVDPRVLAIPREGVVNVHPALLPWVRGNSPLANSLLRGVPLGGTAFRVDAGIDTGPILRRRLLPVREGESVEGLRDAIHRLWVEMTADLVAAAAAAPLPPGSPQRERFPIGRTVADAAQLAAVAGQVRRGVAKALLDRWRPLCDPHDLALPDDADAPFVPHAGG